MIPAMRLLILLLFAFVGLAVPVAAQAPGTDDASRLQALNIARNWLQANTAYKQIPEIRTWVKLSPGQMADQARRGGVVGPANQVSAIYSCGANTLYLMDGVNFNDVAMLSLLVHELTHHAQCSTGASFADLCAVEREAYLNQQRFVRSIQGRLASAGTPLTPHQAQAIEGFARSINPLIETVCAAARKGN